ncbi:hypothetical protein L596_013794 [Steinernema carpocapsae]|uniref:Uncharacterized protein n=1 Tax=Steinernema carpocapsae TaxID=34508 RepID=A0A4U5P180_STECR|nr:hypothetical protein L596_013794 [Steinernema carpocapsae]
MPDPDITFIQRIVEEWKNHCWENDLNKESYRKFQLTLLRFPFIKNVRQSLNLPRDPQLPKQFLFKKRQNGIEYSICGDPMDMSFTAERMLVLYTRELLCLDSLTGRIE